MNEGTPLAAGVLFAVALLFSGQSSTIIATVAGQVVSEGFLNWTISVRASSSACRVLNIDSKLALPPTRSDAVAKSDSIDGRCSCYGEIRNRPTPCRLPGCALDCFAIRYVATAVVDHEQKDHERQEVQVRFTYFDGGRSIPESRCISRVHDAEGREFN